MEPASLARGAEPVAVSRLPALTGLRFLAALGILLFHVGGPLVADGPAWLGRLQRGGHAWVGLFYVLSGFVLARAHPRPMSPAERRAFRRDRLARLYPAYLLAFLLAAPFAAARGWGEGPLAAVKVALVAALTLALLQAWVPPLARLWNPPGWSTSVIASFYLAFPHVCARLGRLSRRGLLAALAGAWALSLALPLAYLALQPDGPGAEALAREPRWLEALKFHPLARAGELCAGVALGLLHARGLRLRRGADAIAAAALAAAAGVVASGRAPYLLLHDGLLVPLYALALLALASSAGPLARALAARPASALGEASFALYVLQDPLWRLARRTDPSAPGPASPGFVLGFCALAVIVALAVSAGLERPVRRFLRAPRTLQSGPPLRLPPG